MDFKHALGAFRRIYGDAFKVPDLARLTGIPKNSVVNYVQRGTNARPSQLLKAGRNLIRQGRLMQRVGVAMVHASKRKPAVKTETSAKERDGREGSAE